LEQVVKVSTKKPKYNATEEVTGDPGNATSTSWDADPSGTGAEVADEQSHDNKKESVEQDVDRLIDADNNEYVLSRSKEGFALMLDPLLIQVRSRCSLLASPNRLDHCHSTG
jgi:hypothetical protein